MNKIKLDNLSLEDCYKMRETVLEFQRKIINDTMYNCIISPALNEYVSKFIGLMGEAIGWLSFTIHILKQQEKELEQKLRGKPAQSGEERKVKGCFLLRELIKKIS